MNAEQLQSIAGQKIIKVETTEPTQERWETCKLLLADGRAVEVLFFERFGGTVKVTERQ